MEKKIFKDLVNNKVYRPNAHLLHNPNALINIIYVTYLNETSLKSLILHVEFNKPL